MSDTVHAMKVRRHNTVVPVAQGSFYDSKVGMPWWCELLGMTCPAQQRECHALQILKSSDSGSWLFRSLNKGIVIAGQQPMQTGAGDASLDAGLDAITYCKRGF